MNSMGGIDTLKKLKILSSLNLEMILIPGNNKILICPQKHGLLKSYTNVKDLYDLLIDFKTDYTYYLHLT